MASNVGHRMIARFLWDVFGIFFWIALVEILGIKFVANVWIVLSADLFR